jgi:hypothetical protein
MRGNRLRGSNGHQWGHCQSDRVWWVRSGGRQAWTVVDRRRKQRPEVEQGVRGCKILSFWVKWVNGQLNNTLGDSEMLSGKLK